MSSKSLALVLEQWRLVNKTCMYDRPCLMINLKCDSTSCMKPKCDMLLLKNQLCVQASTSFGTTAEYIRHAGLDTSLTSTSLIQLILSWTCSKSNYDRILKTLTDCFDLFLQVKGKFRRLQLSSNLRFCSCLYPYCMCQLKS